MFSLLKQVPDVVWFLVSGIGGGLIFLLIRNFVVGRAREVVAKVLTEEDKAKLKDLLDKGLINQKAYDAIVNPPKPIEPFSFEKAKSGFLNITHPTLWTKDLHDIFNLRKLIIVGVILGALYGYGYYKGMGKAKVLINGAEFIMKVDGHYLHWDPKIQEMHIQKSGDPASPEKIKVISVKDIPNLYKKLRPYGFMLEPIFVAGGSLGETGPSFEAGAGISWFKWYKAKLDSFLTYKGLYPLGVSYSITDNSGIGLGAGVGFKGDRRVILYYRFRF